MAKCDYCGSTMFGGVKKEGYRFCNEKCLQQGQLLLISKQIPEEVVGDQIAKIHQGQCPKCEGNGPVDVHISYSIYSVLVMTKWSNTPEVCCRSCGNKSKVRDAVVSAFVGWWGFPWGLIMTPVQLGRNVLGLLKGPDPSKPSAQLGKLIRLRLAAQLAAQE